MKRIKLETTLIPFFVVMVVFSLGVLFPKTVSANEPLASSTTAAAATTATASTSSGGIITCGKTANSMCTLCDVISTMNTIIQYLMKISIFVALAVFTAAGIMYVISAGEPKMIEMAKTAMKNAAIGFIVIFSAFLIIDGIVFRSLGVQKNLGINVVSWGQFVCAPGNH